MDARKLCQDIEHSYKMWLKYNDIPKYISENLKYELFDWQKEALGYFLSCQELRDGGNKKYNHLLFNMATGSGKTLVMAALILYFFKEHGRKHFLFFVNQKNVVDKTENNFINNLHNKYLFRDKIVIDEQTVTIKNVDAFSDEPESIEIKFTTIQQLYNDIYTEKENSTTLHDLQSKNIIMLADEAHHLNVDTKNLSGMDDIFDNRITGRTSSQEQERKGWEHMVINLLFRKYDSKTRTYKPDNENILLEFTATVPDNRNVARKYNQKIIYEFNLKEFLNRGYTKQINLVSSTLAKKERILQALLFQWYRHEIAINNNIHNFKPVILFRSRTIEESKSDYDEFQRIIEDLAASDFTFMQSISEKLHLSQQAFLYETSKSKTESLMKYLEKNEIKYAQIVQWIKNSYQERNLILTNSQSNKTSAEKTDKEQEVLLNSLEDKDNHIRAIFTVKRLTEGWDVLNLFDIVRLYQGQNAGGSNTKTPQATVEEKQLIGRGVRYFPFGYEDMPRNKRKFDNRIDHDLRFLEELFYYTYDEESRYISHLKNSLRDDGYIIDDKQIEEFAFDHNFLNSKFYENIAIWYNEKERNTNGHEKKLKDVNPSEFPAYDATTDLIEEGAFSKKKHNIVGKKKRTLAVGVSEIEPHIFLKAINIKAKSANSFYRFDNLKNKLGIKTIYDLQQKRFKRKDYKIHFEIDADLDYLKLANRHKLRACLKFLDSLEGELKEVPASIGGDFKAGPLSKFFAKPKVKAVSADHIKQSKKVWEEQLKDAKWYPVDKFVGTSEEVSLIEFMSKIMDAIAKSYEEFYLIRNEELYKIYDFNSGLGFCPDFLLLLKTKDIKASSRSRRRAEFFQVFIEPKGEQFLDEKGRGAGKEKWKESFLRQIKERYGGDDDRWLQFENRNYRIIGMPFYNNKYENRFRRDFEDFIMKGDLFKNPIPPIKLK